MNTRDIYGCYFILKLEGIKNFQNFKCVYINPILIVLSVLLWYTVSDYLFGVFKLFLMQILFYELLIFLVLSLFITYHGVCNYINTTGATSVAGTAYPSSSRALEFTLSFDDGFALLDL